MKFTKALLALAALCVIGTLASTSPAAAAACNTTLFSSTKGDVTFPMCPPPVGGATAGQMDNMTIGGNTPRPGSFTTLNTTGAFTSGGQLIGPSLKFTGSAPVPTGTGTPTILAGSTDGAGEVTAGASATSVVITFAAAKDSAPLCVVTSQTQLAAFAYTVSTTAITITQTATSGNKINYHCTQR